MAESGIHIADDRGFWVGNGDTYVRGHAFYGGTLHRSADLLDLVRSTSPAEFEALVAELTGFFSIVKRTGDEVALAVDHVRSFPLYYAIAEGEAYVSNDAQWIKEQLPDPRVDPLLEFEFLLTGVVTGGDTLYPAIKQLEAGETVALERSGASVSATRNRYRRIIENRPPLEANEVELLDRLDAVLEHAFRRLIEVADGRQLAVSLSGGPDSRLLATLLRRHDYEPLVAFTFGREGNWDSHVAAEVANALDIPLEVIRYDHDGWYDWFHSDERERYYRYAFNFDSLFPVGAVPAVKRLRETDRLDDDAIVLCGNTVAARNAYPPSFQRANPTDAASLAEYIVEEYFDFWDWEDDEAADTFRVRIESQLDLRGEASEAAALAALRDWENRNWNAKRLVSPEEYAFWGYDAWTPLWDPAYVELWERLPRRHRRNKRLHTAYADQVYREVTGGASPPPDSPPAGPLGRLEGAIARSPAARFVRPVYERFEDVYKRRTRTPPYHRDPVGTMGIMTAAQFDALYHSYDQDVHPFKALELLGCVTFKPAANLAGPIDGRLDRARLGTPDHEAHRESLPWYQASNSGRQAIEVSPPAVVDWGGDR